MKKLALIAFLISTTLACSEANSAESVAELNGEAITKAELEKVLQAFTGLQTAKLEDYPADFQKEFVNKYIEKKLILDAARAADLQDDPEIAAKIKDAEDYLIEQKFLSNIVQAKQSDEDLQKIYDEAFADKAGKDEFKASHILVATEDEAKDIKKKLDGGADFAKLAGEFSKDPGSKINGGDLGFFTADKMVPEFSKAVAELEVGKISAPIKSDFGWHVIKLVEKRKAQPPTFEQAKPALQQELARRLVDTKVKELREEADIEITMEFKDPAPAEKKDEEKAEPSAEEADKK